MSKIARKPIELPENTKINIDNNVITIEGPKGKLSFQKFSDITVKEETGRIHITSLKKDNTSISGTTRALLSNMVHGVSKGWEKKLALVGVGYRAKADNKNLELNVGYSHPVKYPIPEGIKIETPSQTEIIVTGIDKQQVGQVASEIRSVRLPEPYKGKGIRYSDEHIVKKEAKKK
ncbi:MAG: 50S ribosomal protein L6 [Gammaproteobacteria bacterium]|nr:50S ribosomal protein L6 [Gammaproteobacteria bacterium]|tara:strand:+ start:31187 stop:31714 length:528 start_codon:yes stop_codon:yes gene_type:complete